MHNKLKTFLILPLFSLLLWGCGEDTKVEESTSPTTFAHFAIRYLEGENQLRGQASFSQGDSMAVAKPITIEGGVSFMGSGMKEKDLPKKIIRYDATLNTGFVTPLRFGFKLEGDEKPREISYEMAPLGDFAMQSASKEDGLRIELHSPVSSNEALLLLFTDSNQEVRTILRPGPINKDVLFIPADALLHFITGDYRFYIVKTKREQGLKNGVNTELIIEFYSKEKTFVLN